MSWPKKKIPSPADLPGSMNEQYIHKLTFFTKGSPDVYDEETGQWVPGIPGAEVTIECRAKPNGSGRKKANRDGVLTEYSFDIGIPVETVELPGDTKVKITGVRNEVIFEGEMMGCQVGERSILGWV